MSQQLFSPRQGNRSRWLRLAVFVAVLGIGLYGAWQRQQDQQQPPAPAGPLADEGPTARATAGDEPPREDPADPAAEPPHRTSTAQTKNARTEIPNQIIHNQEGRVAFRGIVDVGPTLNRIHRGERLAFSHDGSTFQNRERRLPQKPPGYYREYVHTTPHLSGPGPQRIILGGEGEIYYTPDHYRTFQRMDER